MSDKRHAVNVESIAKNLELLFENELAEMEVIRSNEQNEMCKVLFSHNIRYMRVFLGFISKQSPYEQKEFAGLLTVSTAGLRRWENAEVIPNKAGLKNVVTLVNQLLQLPTPITAAHLLYRNLVTEIPLLRLGSHSAEFQNLPYEEKRRFSSFMTNNMDLMISHFMEREQQSRLNFQSLMEKVNIPIALVKIGDNQPSFVNQALCELVGIPHEKIREITALELIHSDDRQLVQQFMEAAKRGEISEAHNIMRVLHSSGKFKIVDSHHRLVVIDSEKYSLSTLQDITYRTEMEEAIKNSEEKLRSTLASIDDLIFVIDKKGIITEYYQQDHPDLYVSPDMFLNKRFDEVMPAGVSKKFKTVMNKIFRTGEVQQIEYDLKIQGKNRSFNAKLSLRKNKSGVKTGVIIDARDITEEHETKCALKESEERFRQLSENIRDAFMLREYNRMLYINPTFEKLFGFSLEELKDNPRRIIESIHPDDQDYFRSVLAKFDKKPGPVSFRFRVQQKGKSECWVESRAFPVKGHPGRVAAVVKDITEQVDAENAIKESVESYRLLFTSMFTAFALHEVITDKNGKPINYRFLDVNPAFEKMTGLKAKDIIGKTVLDVLPNTEKYWIDTFGNVALTGKPDSIPAYAGELGKYYEVHGYSPKKGQFAVTFIDVTERVMTLHKKNT